jgi:hypothetical protein
MSSKLDLFPSSGEGRERSILSNLLDIRINMITARDISFSSRYQTQQISPYPHLKKEVNPLRETLSFLVM